MFLTSQSKDCRAPKTHKTIFENSPQSSYIIIVDKGQSLGNEMTQNYRGLRGQPGALRNIPEGFFMKLRNKLTAITAAAMLAFAGVGFAAWTFDTTKSDTATAEGYVTSAINAESVTVTGDTFYLVLDQVKPYWTKAIETGSKPVEITASDKLTVTPVFSSHWNQDGASWDWALTTTITPAAGIATYVDFGTLTTSGTVSGTITEASHAAITPVEYNLPTVTYTASKPTTFAQYETMLAAAEDQTIEFTFTFTLTPGAGN